MSLKKFLLPAIKDLYPILLLAVAQLVILCFKFDFSTYMMVLLFFSFLLMQQLQKNYYTPHFNSCWAPICILASKTIYDIGIIFSNNETLGWLLIFALAIMSIAVLRKIILSFSKDQRDVLGFMGSLIGLLFSHAAVIGSYIKHHSQETDRLLVWGDQPSIYLYAQREAFDPDYLFIYTHNLRMHDPREEHALIEAFRKNPPEWIVFYNYKFDDGWNMQSLSEKTGIPYTLHQRFRLCDPEGKVLCTANGVLMDFPLYRRNETVYKDILIDKAIASGVKNENVEKRKYLEEALRLFPGDCEATFRLSLLGRNGEGNDACRHFLEEEGSVRNDNIKESIILLLLGELDMQEGNMAGALEKYLRARNMREDDFRAYNGLGEACLHLGKTQQALRFFEKALELNSFSADALQ